MAIIYSDYDGKIRLWSHEKNLSEHLIISAHGEHTNIFSDRFSRNFHLDKGKVLHFFTDNHTAMTDRTLMSIAREENEETDKDKYVGPKDTANYNLFYYNLDQDNEIRAACNNTIGLKYPDVAQVIAEEGSSLSELLDIIQVKRADTYANYKHIYCSFCRVGYQWRAHKFD